MNTRFIRAIIILPGTGTIFFPAYLLWLENGHTFSWERWNNPVALLSGIMILFAGLSMVYHSAGLFLNVGKGTPAPWDPPRKLVIRGTYRYVRNPMITGVLCIVLGESLVFGSLYLFVWFAAFFVLNHIYFSLFEEPGLRKRFGNEYDIYARNVPRWIPRIRPYEPDEEND